jgi:two-component system, sensor histidine kinase
MSLRQLVRILLTCRGYLVDEAENGLAALALMAQCHYDLILMDCLMPVMDGYETSRRLREHEAATGAVRTPVIAFTAGTQEDDRELCRAAGMDDYLVKPFTPEDLTGAVARWLCARPGAAP